MKHFYHCRKFCWVGSTTLEYFCITFTQISSFLLENIEHSHNLMGYNVPCKILKIHFYVFYILPHKQILLCSFLIFYKVFHHQFSIKFLVSSVLTWYLHICQNYLSHIVFFFKKWFYCTMKTRPSQALLCQDSSWRVLMKSVAIDRSFHLLCLLTTAQQFMEWQKTVERNPGVKDNSWALVFCKYFSSRTHQRENQPVPEERAQHLAASRSQG